MNLAVCKLVFDIRGKQLKIRLPNNDFLDVRVGDSLLDFLGANIVIPKKSTSLCSIGKKIADAMEAGEKAELTNQQAKFLKEIILLNKFKPDQKMEPVDYFFPFVHEQILALFS